MECRVHGHDGPEELTGRLRAAGFVPAEAKTVLVGLSSDLTAEPELPEGVVVRRVTAEGDMRRITDCAGLLGGTTLPAWRGRGIYRSLVAARAGIAAARGVRYLQVDATDDSCPILSALGFRAVTTLTPYVWTPPGR